MCLPTNEFIKNVLASGKFAKVSDLIEFAKSNNHKEAFIIGNSTGLRQITDEQWQRVKNGFSLGFNGIPLFEDFAPNVWMFEINNFWLSHIGQDIFKSAETRLDCVENFFLIKDTFCTETDACKAVVSFAEKIKHAKITIIPQDIFIEGNTFQAAKDNYKRLFENIAQGKIKSDFLVRKRGSVTMGIFLLLIAGFKRINFVGVDLQNSAYFYDDCDSGKVHGTEDPVLGMPISDVISAMIQAYNEIHTEKVEIYAASGRLLDKKIAKKLDWEIMGANRMKFVTWLWGDRNWHSSYGPEHVNLLADCIRRNYKGKAEFYCVTDNPEGLGDDITIIPLWPDFSDLGHCYRRLKAFSKEFGEMIGGKFCSIDLDVVITGDLTEIIDNAPDFAIMKDFQPPTPYNGSFFIMEPGARLQVWEEFIKDPQKLIAKGDKLGYCACDQKIIATVLGKGERVLGDSDGFYSYKFAIKQRGNKLPENAKVIAFHGTGKPWHNEYRAIDWVKKNCRYTKRAIVLGGASGVWDELKALGNVVDNAAIIAVNDSGYAYSGKIDYWVTLHPEKFAVWRKKRADNGYNMDFVSVGHNSTNIKPENMDKGMNEYVNGKLWHGSSGLFAVKAAIEHGFDEVILCGVPMNGDVNIHRGESWKQFNDFRNGWKEVLPELKGRVYSQSGWTADLLGKFM